LHCSYLQQAGMRAIYLSLVKQCVRSLFSLSLSLSAK
jgi:hypothetical protein